MGSPVLSLELSTKWRLTNEIVVSHGGFDLDYSIMDCLNEHITVNIENQHLALFYDAPFRVDFLKDGSSYGVINDSETGLNQQ